MIVRWLTDGILAGTFNPDLSYSGKVAMVRG